MVNSGKANTNTDRVGWIYKRGPEYSYARLENEINGLECLVCREAEIAKRLESRLMIISNAKMTETEHFR